MNNLANELTAVSVILVFVTVAFNLIMPAIWDELGISVDLNYKTDIAKANKLIQTNNMLYRKVWPLTIFCLFVGWLLTPTTCSIIIVSNFSIWDFELINTLFVLINILIYVMVGVLAVTIIRLLRRIKKLN